jgi:hypothetical protein
MLTTVQIRAYYKEELMRDNDACVIGASLHTMSGSLGRSGYAKVGNREQPFEIRTINALPPLVGNGYLTSSQAYIRGCYLDIFGSTV